MANDYFNHVANVIAEGIRALAAQVNNIATEISTGLDKLPTEIELKRGLTRFAVDTGAADAYVVDLPYIPALVDGLEVSFRPVNTNTGASTINVNSLGAKAIVLFDLNPLVTNAIVVGSMVTVRYSAIGDHFIIMSGFGNAVTTGGANTELQYNNNSVMGGMPEFVFNNSATTGNQFAITALAGLTSGDQLLVYNDVAGKTGQVVRIWQSEASANAIALNVIQTGAAVGLKVAAAGAGDALDLSTTNTANSALRVSTSTVSRTGALIDVSDNGTGTYDTAFFRSINTGKSGNVVNIVQDHASSSAIALNIQQDGTAAALKITHNNGRRALDIIDADTVAASDYLVQIYSNNALRGLDMVRIIQDSATSLADALFIQQDGDAPAIGIDHNGASNGSIIDIDATNAGYDGNAIDVNISDASAAGVGLSIVTAGTGRGISVVMSGINDGIYAQQNTTDGTAILAYSNIASRTQPLMEIINDNATGSGVALAVQSDQGRGVQIIQNSNNDALFIDHLGTTGQLISLVSNIAGRNTAEHMMLIHQDHASASCTVAKILNDGSGNALEIESRIGTGLRVITNATGGGHLVEIESNQTSQVNALLDIIQNHASSAATCLELRQDGTAALAYALLVTDGPIKVKAIHEVALSYIVTTGTRNLVTQDAAYFYPTGAMTAVNVDFTFGGFIAASGDLSSFTLELNNMVANTDATPWPTSVDWPGGTEPVWTSGIDVVTFWTRDNGTTWHGAAVTLDSS